MGLAVRHGQSEHWPLETIEEVFDRRLKEMGLR